MHVLLHAIPPFVIAVMAVMAAAVAAGAGAATGAAGVAAATATAAGAGASAAAGAAGVAYAADAVEPITCWWRTSAGSVRVGQPFSVFLTCAVAETEAMRVRVDDSRLDPTVLQLPPFDVIGGRRAEDLTSDGRRFLQFEYNARLIAEQGFGDDVSVPSLQVTYRVERRAARGAAGGASGGADAASQVAGGARAAGAVGTAGTAAAAGAVGTAGPVEAEQGRELTYALPPLPIRIASVVPDAAVDIREAAVPSLVEIEQGAFRGTMSRVLAGVLFALGALTLGIALVRSARRQGAASTDAARGLSDRAILLGARRELTMVQEAARESGWTPDLAARALTVARIAATSAEGRPLAQRPARDAVAMDGQLLVRDGFRDGLRLGRPQPPAFVSGAATAEGFARALAATPSRNGAAAAVGAAAADADHRELQTALAQLTTACYGRASVSAPATGTAADASNSGHPDAALDTATEQTLRVIDALAAEHTWIAETRRVWTRALASAKERVWRR